MERKKRKSLYRAISQNNFDGLVKAVSQGALINANDRFGHTPLHYSAFKGNTRFLDYLLQNGGDPNARGKHLSTPLHSAAWGRNMEVFELLLEDGADVDARTDEGETPCMTAALRGEKEMLEVLFALSADPHAVDSHGSNLIDLAAAGGHSEIVKLLSEMGVQENNPLHVAAGTGNLLRLKQLLKNGHKVNARDGFGATPLLIAIVSGNMEVVQFLLSKGADPMIEAKDGYTLMHGAAFSGSKQMVRLASPLVWKSTLDMEKMELLPSMWLRMKRKPFLIFVHLGEKHHGNFPCSFPTLLIPKRLCPMKIISLPTEFNCLSTFWLLE